MNLHLRRHRADGYVRLPVRHPFRRALRQVLLSFIEQLALDDDYTVRAIGGGEPVALEAKIVRWQPDQWLFASRAVCLDGELRQAMADYIARHTASAQ